jgi:hypothetical protein
MIAEQIETEIKRELARFHFFTKLKVLLRELIELRKRFSNLEGKKQCQN